MYIYVFKWHHAGGGTMKESVFAALMTLFCLFAFCIKSFSFMLTYFCCFSLFILFLYCFPFLVYARKVTLAIWKKFTMFCLVLLRFAKV